ncbi:MAG: hypothetical protein MJE12_14490 [Alphaproteobacteria bacterium]|nr:hypothetical protein [Alphaproteobacteria bacterium]
MVDPIDRKTNDPQMDCDPGPIDTPADKIIDLSDHMRGQPVPRTTADDLDAQIANQRRRAVKSIDRAIRHLDAGQDVFLPIAENGLTALRCARRILRELDVDAPDSQHRLDDLASKLTQLSTCLRQIAEIHSAAVCQARQFSGRQPAHPQSSEGAGQETQRIEWRLPLPPSPDIVK